MPATRTATRTLTTTEAAVLSLLAIEGENSGYDLLKYVQKAIGYVWAPARSQLYSLLPRLVKDGYARSRSVSPVRAAGQDALQDHARRPADARRAGWTHVDPNDRAAFQLRLFVGALTDDDVLVRHVEAFRSDTAERLAEYRAIEPTNSRSGADFYHYLLLRRGIQQAELDLEWADWVLRALRRPHA